LCLGSLLDSLGLELAEELFLLGIGLETTMSVLGRGIDELNLEFLGLPRLSAGEESLADCDGSLASSHDTTLDEKEVFVDATVVREATNGSDVLVDGISLAHGVVDNTMDGTGSNSVDLLVDLGSRVITLLTTAGNRPLDGGRMPGSDTSDLAETSMRLTVKSGTSESLDGTNHTFTAGNANSVNNFVHVEDIANFDLLLELAIGKVDLLSNGTTVNLNFQDMGLALTETKFADLGSGKDTDGSAVFLDAGEIAVN
jgi:hypothetical protein